MDRTSSNPLFNREDSKGMERGPAPIPEEYLKPKGPRPLPRAPSAPPPEDIVDAVHEDFERARQEAARRREARPSSFRRFLPRFPSSPSKGERDAHVDPLEIATESATENPDRHFMESARRSLSPLARFLPRMPSKPHTEVSDQEHDEFDRLKQQAEERRGNAAPKPPPGHKLPRPPSKLPEHHVDDALHAEYDRLRALAGQKRGFRGSTALNRALGKTQSLFLDPPPLQATPGEDDGEKIYAPPPKPEPKFKTTRERIIYEIQYRHAIERALMAGLAVCLLWLTSLAVAQAIVNSMIKSPTLTQVSSSIERAVNTTVEERDLYASCAHRRAGNCNATFIADLQAEVILCDNALIFNRALLDNYTNARGNCSDAFGDVILSIDYLVKIKGEALIPPFTLVANLSQTAECANVEKILADQIAAISALKTAEVFQAIADEEVTSVHEQFRARANYDLEYTTNATVGLLLGGDDLNELRSDPKTFFQNMSSKRDKMFACTTSSGTYGNATCGGLSLMQEVTSIREQLKSNYEAQRVQATSSMNALLDEFAPIRNFYVAFKTMVDRYAPIKAGLDGAANDNGAGGGGLGAFGYFDIDTNIPPLVLQSLQSFSSGIDTTLTAAGINSQNLNRVASDNEKTENQMVQDDEATKEGFKSWQDSFLSDYNPPPYDIELSATNWEITTTGYLPEVQSDLSLVAKRVSTQAQQGFVPNSNSTESGRKALEVIQDYQVTGFEPYSYDNIDPDSMLFQWHEINNLALAMDYLYRTLRSISIIRTYWRVSAVLAPPADVRVGLNFKKGTAMRVRRNPDQALAYIITHPVVNLIVALAFLGTASALFLGLYNPVFNAYVAGCPQKASNYQVAGNKTFLTDNVYQVALQYANRDGDIYTSTEIDRINMMRELECSKNEDLVFRQQRLYRQELDFNIEKWTELMVNVDSFRACINASAIDAAFPGLAFNATNGTSTSVHSALFHPTCNKIPPVLDPKEFNCAAIRRCDPTCTGANNATVGRTTWDAGCTTEYYIHSGVLGTAFAALAFILMNLSRWTFLRGLRRALMSHFAMGDYSYLATTDEHGNIEYPEKVTLEGQSMKDVIRDELHDTIKRYERSGIYICIIALMLNFPWVIGLIKFSENLTFSAASA